MIKINWGSGIAIFFGLFVITLVFLVIKTTQYDHSLVANKYYEKDLNYQEHYIKLVNNLSLEKDLSIEQDAETKTVRFVFPQTMKKVEGEVLFFRPSDDTKDINLSILLDENNSLEYPYRDLIHGLWKIKVDWAGDGKSYYKEQDFNF